MKVFVLLLVCCPWFSSLSVQGKPRDEKPNVNSSDAIGNGTHSSTLTCNAPDVDSNSSMTWSGIACENGGTKDVCPLSKTDAANHLRNLKCNATSTTDVTESVQLNFTYLWQEEQLEQSQKGNGTLKTSDTLTCRLKSGESEHGTVEVYCLTPLLSDTAGEMTCFCNTALYITSRDYQPTTAAVYEHRDKQPNVNSSDVISNGTDTFTLTCNATDVDSNSSMTWGGITCEIGGTKDVCHRTQTDAANHLGNVTCYATSPTNVTETVQLKFTAYHPHEEQLKQSQKENGTLQTPDNLLCRLKDGESLHDTVQVNCLTTVLSTTTVEMTCFCNAALDMPSRVYWSTTAAVRRERCAKGLWRCDSGQCIPEEKRCNGKSDCGDDDSDENNCDQAVIKSLTLNGRHDTMTVGGGYGVDVDLKCEVFGRPVPLRVIITKGIKVFNPQYSVKLKEFTRGATVRLPDVRCQDMGTYTCTADNGVGDAATRSIRLNVNCKPGKVSRSSWNPRRQGIDVTLEAHPVPTTFIFKHFDSPTSTFEKAVSPNTFLSECKQDPVAEFLVNCNITLRSSPQLVSGYYKASLYNGLGGIDIAFTIPMEEKEEGPVVWKAVIGASFGVITIVLIVVTAIFVYRRRNQIYRATRTTVNRISGLYADADDPIANRPRSILPLHDFMPERPLPQLPSRPVNGCDDDYTDPVDSPKFGGNDDTSASSGMCSETDRTIDDSSSEAEEHFDRLFSECQPTSGLEPTYNHTNITTTV